jgi:hypothetical protein
VIIIIIAITLFLILNSRCKKTQQPFELTNNNDIQFTPYETDFIKRYLHPSDPEFWKATFKDDLINFADCSLEGQAYGCGPLTSERQLKDLRERINNCNTRYILPFDLENKFVCIDPKIENRLKVGSP